ncbi:MAG: enoyl-CoA hydratase-related protein, partial [Ramlibacter sp.]
AMPTLRRKPREWELHWAAGISAATFITGRVYNAQDGERIGFAQYLVPEGKATEKALELAERVAQNAPLTNFALMHALPRIAEQPADQGFLTESLMAAIAQSAPEAKTRVRDFLEGRANKVKKA